MAETKRHCADCENVEPCDMLERCIKHEPAPPTFDNYTRLSTPEGTHIEHCPVCAADPEVWQYIAKEGDVAQKVVMCSHDDEIGPHDALAGGGCPLYMPPQSFYRPTIREAVKHWNEYAKALSSLRRKNGWKHAQVLRGNAGVAASGEPHACRFFNGKCIDCGRSYGDRSPGVKASDGYCADCEDVRHCGTIKKCLYGARNTVGGSNGR